MSEHETKLAAWLLHRTNRSIRITPWADTKNVNAYACVGDSVYIEASGGTIPEALQTLAGRLP